MSTRRQRRSPKWLKRQRQKRQRQRAAHKVFIEADYGHAVSHFVATQWVWFEGRCFAFDADHPEEPERAIAETGLATAEVTWDSITITPPTGSSSHCEVKGGEVLEPVHVHLNRAQRRARGLL